MVSGRSSTSRVLSQGQVGFAVLTGSPLCCSGLPARRCCSFCCSWSSGPHWGVFSVGVSRRERHPGLKESSGVLQGALLGFMGLVLAFGLSLALGRYEDRRAAVVDDANSIGTTYLRAQTLPEPMRSRSLPLLVKYTDVERALTHEVPGSEAADHTIAQGDALHNQLWTLNGQALQKEPTASCTASL